MSDDKGTKMERLLKLYALAMRGEGGEKENARRILDAALASATGVTFEDVERAAQGKERADERQWRDFVTDCYVKGLESVVAQLVFSFGLRDEGQLKYYLKPLTYFEKHNKEKVLSLLLSDAEYYLTSMFFDAACQAFAATHRNMVKRHRRECADLPDVFIAHNRLFDLRPSKVQREDDGDAAGEPPSFAFSREDLVSFDHEHDRHLPDARLQLEGGKA